MYCYIYDESVQDRPFERDLIAIEHRVTDLGLQGKIVRLALFRDPEQTIREEVARGMKTVVVVGNDQTVHRVANAVVDSGAVLAIVPLGEPNVFARILGIPMGVEAIDVLSKRVIEHMDVGRVNDRRFFTGVQFPLTRATVRAGRKYEMRTLQRGLVAVKNLAVDPPKRAEELSNPMDGRLEVEIVTYTFGLFRKVPARSRILLSTFDVVTDDPVTALVDGAEFVADRFQFKTEKGALKVVVSRERMFEGVDQPSV